MLKELWDSWFNAISGIVYLRVFDSFERYQESTNHLIKREKHFIIFNFSCKKIICEEIQIIGEIIIRMGVRESQLFERIEIDYRKNSLPELSILEYVNEKWNNISEISSENNEKKFASGIWRGEARTSALLFARNNDNSVPRTIEALLPPK